MCQINIHKKVFIVTSFAKFKDFIQKFWNLTEFQWFNGFFDLNHEFDFWCITLN